MAKLKQSKRAPRVAVLMGSDSDWDAVSETERALRNFGVECDVKVLSAHRTPDRAAAYARAAERRGIRILIAAAGGAAHLAGVVAAHTTLPVIGIPIRTDAMDGLDALLSTVQMPGGIPVATVAVGKAGAVNAAILAVQILALTDAGLRRRLRVHKRALKAKVADANRRLSRTRGRDR